MTVLLRQPTDLPAEDAYDAWVAIGDAPASLDAARTLPGLGAAIEAAFDDSVGEWLDVGRDLSQEPSADLAHTPSCISNLSDFGLMLGWNRLVADWAAAPRRILVTVADPWMFRHFAAKPGVESGRKPPLRRREIALALRGFAARVKASLTFARAAVVLRGDRKRYPDGAAALLVYGHPRSTADGTDGYFGEILRRLESLRRVLHVDCPPARARALGRDDRTFSLHAWGSPLAALSLVGARWRPRPGWKSHPLKWLVRRAAVREGGTAGGAAIRWQQICHANWLRAARPAVAAWPWENHTWERDFVLRCRDAGVDTVGYQHSVAGRQMVNYSPGANPGGLTSVPDRILCTGEAYRKQLVAWGQPEDRVRIGGAWRFSDEPAPAWEADAPVFVALPFDGRVAGEMVAAARTVRSRNFLVKPHPMTPHRFPETDNVRYTDKRMQEQDSLSSVVYAASTVGLESLIAGLPTGRFRPQSCLAIDILPQGYETPTVDAETFARFVEGARPSAPWERSHFFAPVDLPLWQHLLERGAANAKCAEE